MDTNHNQAHILIVDDDERIRNLIQKFLLRNGFFVSVARDAAHARSLLSSLEFDMIVLDVMMPGEDGLSLTIDLRKILKTPILLLTAKSESNERIMGFEAGADDYLTKPFEPKELVLRINAILRRMPKEDLNLAPPKSIHMGKVRYDISRGELWDDNALVKLTATESALLKIFHPAFIIQ
jgi:two-component system phosphate regulon response regulator OmpR